MQAIVIHFIPTTEEDSSEALNLDAVAE